MPNIDHVMDSGFIVMHVELFIHPNIQNMEYLAIKLMQTHTYTHTISCYSSRRIFFFFWKYSGYKITEFFIFSSIVQLLHCLLKAKKNSSLKSLFFVFSFFMKVFFHDEWIELITKPVYHHLRLWMRMKIDGKRNLITKSNWANSYSSTFIHLPLIVNNEKNSRIFTFKNTHKHTTKQRQCCKNRFW